jgi:hypothetical protein
MALSADAPHLYQTIPRFALDRWVSVCIGGSIRSGSSSCALCPSWFSSGWFFNPYPSVQSAANALFSQRIRDFCALRPIVTK